MIASSSPLSPWESFYVIVGSSGGALIGLQFVVVTLIADRQDLASRGSLSAFGTPTVVHFGGALVLSALMSAPWSSLGPLSAALGLFGIAGIAFSALVIHRTRRQTGYQPDAEDWFWYSWLPCFAYAVLTVTAFVLRSRTEPALFVVGAVTLGLLLIGIHNAWDSITHIVLHGKRD